MAIYSGLVKACTFLVSVICNFIVPIVESIALKVRIGGGCECPSPLSSPSTDRGRRHKKLKNNANGSGGVHHNDVKRIKLLLDITVARNGNQVLDIQASSARGNDDGYRDKKSQRQQCIKNPGLVLTILNSPSSIMLMFVSKVRELSHNLEALEHQSCDDPNRVKKSPKRRITRANYRKIIPFFPFNLLGFSNYSAFQMPTITRSSSSTTATGSEETNNLNVSSVSASGNGKTRCKRRRNSSTEDDSCSSLSDEDISYLELPEKSSCGSLLTTGPSAAGHDEVDSDETGDTLTKRITTSSSSSDNNPLLRNQPTSANDGSKKITVTLNTSNSGDNSGGGNVTTVTDLDSSSNGIVGEEQQVRFSFIEELNEAANESYNSQEDPDYVPPEHFPSSSDTSFATDKGCSDESLLEEIGATKPNGKGMLISAHKK